VGVAMIPALLASGIIFYGIIQLIAAFLAVFLAVKWNKYEFLPGLFFLLLYAIIEVTDLFFFTIVKSIFIDVAQFGFILLAIISFIIGMHPSYAKKMTPGIREQSNNNSSSPNESAISILKKF
jgi:hypothetical protein